jgi:2-desacetyl-2-hydroxyethyl bacteriochlorophyllide A dehydrogenase
MKAAIFKGSDVLEVEEVPDLEPGPDQIKVKIAFCGICGTDPETLAGHFPPIKPPAIIGHEPSGTIAELGKNVSTFKIGQNVACNFRSPCGWCYYCRSKMEHFCENVHKATGGFAEYALFHKNGVYTLPENVSLETGALLEPVSVAVHAIDLANIYPGSSVAIIGAGSIGLLLLQLAVRSGAAKVLVSEPIQEKRNMAKELGADVVVDPLKEDLEKASKLLTDSRGFNTVIEVSGKIGPAKQAIQMAAKCGTVLLVSVYPSTAELGLLPYQLYANELTIRSTRVSPYTFPRSVALLPKLQLKPLITDVYPLKDIKKGFDQYKMGKAIKILIKPQTPEYKTKPSSEVMHE